MGDALFGYDMVLQVTQNEINSQFSRLMQQGYIRSLLKTNGLATAGGAFGGGAMTLTSYLRGYIAAPSVAQPMVILASGDNPQQCLFQFALQSQPLTQTVMEQLGFTQAQVDAAFASPQPGPDNSQYGLLVNHEDIAFGSNGEAQTLPNQTVYYWLKRTSVTVGTTTTYSNYLVPGLFYMSGGLYPTLVDLSGLPLRFTVNLDSIPTTPQGIAELVDKGIMPPQVLDTINGSGFNSAYFSLKQLFLNFDTTDFTQWSTTAPPTSTAVTGASIDTASNTFSVSTTTLAQLVGDPGFLTEVSVALQYAFGVGATYDGNPSSTPYIIGVTVTSSNPAQTDPDSTPLLVPTSVGFSSLRNTADSGLSVLNYQVMGGGNANPIQPAPSVGTNFVTSNDYSGELLFSEDVFFRPEIFNPLVQALTSVHAPPASWRQNGMTFTYQTSYEWLVRSTPPPDNRVKTGTYMKVTQKESPNYTIAVSGNTVNVSGSLSITQKLAATLEVLSIEIPLVWSVTCQTSFSQALTLAVGGNGYDLVVNHSQATFSKPVNGPLESNNWEAGLSSFVVQTAWAIIDQLFPTSKLIQELNPARYTVDVVHAQINNTFNKLNSQLNKGLTGGATGNFISPTGAVFLLNAPRFNDALALQMDVTYGV
ncbi:hypothetical protein [Myxococcus sp. AB036A]|uniref:hypothetical protein n=1 Tax=Myxococcus sp. AB036A TaxID=2562793 RepID=UPI0011469F29|nr:hypothetical protein [Myxococcus sp. AB036A]